MTKPGFNIYEFKKWLDNHPDNLSIPDYKLDRIRMETDPIIGSHTTSKVAEAKIVGSIENIEGDKEQIIAEFLEKGGTTTKNYGKRVLVEVSCGTFSIPRFCVKLEKAK